MTPKYTLEAIAAAIYAERIKGITSRKCDWCGELFPIGRHKDKLYCGTKRCKGNARKKRSRDRKKERKAKEFAASKPQKVSTKKATTVLKLRKSG